MLKTNGRLLHLPLWVGGAFPVFTAFGGSVWVGGGRMDVLSEHTIGNLRYMSVLTAFRAVGGITYRLQPVRLSKAL